MIPRNTPTQTVDAPALQFASGKTQARFAATAKFTGFVGFHSERGKDAAFDAALADLGVPTVEIKHPRPGGAEIKTHWSFGETIRFHPITAGPVAPTVAGLLRRAAETAEAGIGVRWADGERSRLALRGFVALQRDGAWSAPILQITQLSVKSKMTDRLLAALLDHLRIVQAADDLVDRSKHPELVSFHELALPLITGDEEEWGKGDTATVTPLRSGHPETIDRASIKTPKLWRSDALHDCAVAVWPAVQQWAAEYAAGADGDGNGHAE